MASLSRRNSRNSRNSASYSSNSSRWSARIEKPSPRHLERRKTLGTKPYATLEDHYKAMFGDSTSQDGVETATTIRRSTTRPVSWHPSSRPYAPDSVTFDDFPLPPSSSTLSPESVDAPALSSNPSPYEATYHSFESSPRPHSIPNMTYSPTGDMDTEPFVHIAPSWRSFEEEPLYSADTITSTMQYEQPIFTSNFWSHQPRDSQNSYLSSTTVTSDFLPVQLPPGQQEPPAKDSPRPISRRGSNELIGLGLYDPPDTANSLLTSGFPSTGKGLKLEETWEPPEQDSDGEQEVDDDGDGEQDADGESSEEEEELQDEPHMEPSRQQGSWFPAKRRYLTTNMSGQSFFFDDDTEGMHNEWWSYKQPKRPTVQDAGMIHGWVS